MTWYFHVPVWLCETETPAWAIVFVGFAFCFPTKKVGKQALNPQVRTGVFLSPKIVCSAISLSNALQYNAKPY